jgi:hypothetical protein
MGTMRGRGGYGHGNKHMHMAGKHGHGLKWLGVGHDLNLYE